MQIEELTEQMANAMAAQGNSNDGQPGTGSDATKPALPPQLAMTAGKTSEEILAELNKSPLFMTDLEEDNDDIAALQALNYEGSALENAAGFKERGNECFKVKGYVDAREFYDKGVAVLAGEERKRARGEVTTDPEGNEDSAEEVAAQRAMLEAFYVNRAACHLELGNYRSCWTDCARALGLNPRSVKACYRSARALVKVDRVAEAEDICARGLALDPGNKSLLAAAEEIAKRARAVGEKQRREAEREARDKRRAALLRAALAARGIATRRTAKPPDMEDAGVELAPDPDDPRSELTFPALLLYPCSYESDFVRAFGETQTMEDHLAYVLPPPWDEGKGEYGDAAAVECYVETVEGGLLKMGKRVPLLKMLAGGRVEVVDELVKIFVVPVGKSAEWVKKFKEDKAKMKR